MALSKTFTTVYGKKISYWSITEIKINWFQHSAVVELSGFVDEKSRKTGSDPVERRFFYWAGEDFPFQKDGHNIKSAYAKIKAKIPPFKDDQGNIVQAETNFFDDAKDV